nr:UDP-glycosyltransferase UGT5-like isoform X1 [Helicoverpa armigera]WRX06260.1 UGT33F2A-like protein [Helicoverpa armigera]
MSVSVLNIFVVCGIFISFNEAARILAVFPVPSISHQVVFRPLTQELARRGHEVTVITPDPVFKNSGAPPNLTEIDVHDVSYNIWKESFIKAASKGVKDDSYSQMEIIMSTFSRVFDAQLKTDVVQNLIKDKSKQFDLLLLEACVRPALAFSHIYKNVPVILVSSLGAAPGNYEVIGASEHPILYPNLFRKRLYNLSLWEKIEELYEHYRIVKFFESNTVLENQVLRDNFGPEIPTVHELGNNVDMLFLNINPVFEGIRPVPPSVVYMGGLHQKPAKELPTDLKTYLDSSTNGVIYISFGTNVAPSMLPPERIQILVKVFSELPYDVLWKWDKDELPGRSKNIRISKWLPQSDLLRHPKVKLFITQGGLQSTDEAITAGVPLIGVPMLADQWFNVEKYVYLKIGLQLDLETLTEEQFRNAINTIVKDDSYKRNIEKLRSVMEDQPMKPLERAVWWTEHVLRHGGARHLRSPAANMSWAEYLELELVLIVLAGLLAVLTAIFGAIYALCRCFTKEVSVKHKSH